VVRRRTQAGQILPHPWWLPKKEHIVNIRPATNSCPVPDSQDFEKIWLTGRPDRIMARRSVRLPRESTTPEPAPFSQRPAQTAAGFPIRRTQLQERPELPKKVLPSRFRICRDFPCNAALLHRGSLLSPGADAPRMRAGKQALL